MRGFHYISVKEVEVRNTLPVGIYQNTDAYELSSVIHLI